MNMQFDAPDHYIESSALHEFGHALGFHHEHRRTNEDGELVTDSWCQWEHPTKSGDSGNIKDGTFLSDEYDANSIMSYCPQFKQYFNAISEDDAGGIQKYYGAGEKGVILKAAVATVASLAGIQNSDYADAQILPNGIAESNMSCQMSVSSGSDGGKFKIDLTDCFKESPEFACFNVEGKRVHLGMFFCVIKAAKAYDAAARKYYGEFACTNFQKGTENEN